MSERLMKRAFWALAAATIVLAGVLSYFAHSGPDALEHSLGAFKQPAPAPVVESSATAVADSSAEYKGLLPDYRVPGVRRPFISGGAAGIIGAAIAFVVIVAVGAVLKRAGRRKKTV